MSHTDRVNPTGWKHTLYMWFLGSFQHVYKYTNMPFLPERLHMGFTSKIKDVMF